MKYLNPEDPNFTAKALGENLSDDSAEIPAEHLEEFEELQSFTHKLKKSIQKEETNQTLEAERISEIKKPKSSKILRYPTWIGAIAALLLIALVMPNYESAKREIDSERVPEVIDFSEPNSSKNSRKISETSVVESTVHEKETDPAPVLKNDSFTTSSDLVDQYADKNPKLQIDLNKKPTPSTEREKKIEETPVVLEQSGPKSKMMERPRAQLVGDETKVTQPDYNPGSSKTAPGVFQPAKVLKPVATSPVNLDEEILTSSPYVRSKVEASQTGATTSYERTKTAIPQARPPEANEEDIYELSPFAVEAEKTGYTTRLIAGKKRRVKIQAPSSRLEHRLPLGQNVEAPAVAQPPQIAEVESFNREGYSPITENSFKNPLDHPLSTFSIDVDTASYSNTRRMLNWNQRPPIDSVRIEEFINYFSYDYAAPEDEHPFAVHLDSASAPWNKANRLVRIALKGKELDLSERADANLVFLVDVSGSMNDRKKLPLVKKSLSYIIEKMSASDRIAIVVYAGASGLALPSTTANNQETIQHALDRLSAGGSTNGGAGIELAYKVAQEHFIENGINRVILCTDGDFNVGVSDQGSLQRLIEEKAKSGVFFSAIGFGSGNYRDDIMELLSNKGNGNYAYIDSDKEARKVFVQNLLGTLYTIAKDVKIQVEFNPEQVAAYRLIGYENRMLAKEDFNNDKKDAGEIGAGHTVTALYEIVPTGQEAPTVDVDDLRYQKPAEQTTTAADGEMLTVKLRYKEPDGDTSKLIAHHLIDSNQLIENADEDFRFASGVAAFAMILRNSSYVGEFSSEDVKSLISGSLGKDSGGYRSELLELIDKFQSSR